MWKAFLVPLNMLLMLGGFGDAQSTSNCLYRAELEPGVTYYVFNPDYAGSYSGAHQCTWHAKSSYKIKLTCGLFELPPSLNCTLDEFVVQTGTQKSHRYCGNGTFSTMSESNNMTIRFTSRSGTPGGKFLCLLQAVTEYQLSDNCNCGYKNQNRIVGGIETGVNEFPMMAGIVDFRLRRLFCGGTIISNKYVLTAAHCTNNKVPDQLAVLVGDHDISTGDDTNASQLFRVSDIAIHPSYVKVTYGYDVSVLTVQGSITFTSYVGPACLPFQHRTDSFGGDLVDVLGWGTTEYGGSTSDTLQKVRLSVLTRPQCSRTYNTLTSGQICTQGFEKDSCQFDSGGPVLWENPTSRKLVLVGAISYGGICTGDTPGVNSRIGDYIDWISSVTPEATFCMNE